MWSQQTPMSSRPCSTGDVVLSLGSTKKGHRGEPPSTRRSRSSSWAMAKSLPGSCLRIVDRSSDMPAFDARSFVLGERRERIAI
jgi:hypothetical protein